MVSGTRSGPFAVVHRQQHPAAVIRATCGIITVHMGLLGFGTIFRPRVDGKHGETVVFWALGHRVCWIQTVASGVQVCSCQNKCKNPVSDIASVHERTSRFNRQRWSELR